MYFLKKIWHPERFQGNLKRKKYFEGWYFKIADRSLRNIYAVIPGISMTEHDNDSHCFIQVLDGIKAQSRYFRYPLGDFSYSKKGFEITVANSTFSNSGMHLDIDDKDIRITSELNFSENTGWPKKLFSPGAMGWYSYLPFMECYHGVVSMDHKIGGILSFGGIKIDFTGGRGYIEKDWGTSFPEGWIWLQSNNFSKEKTSIMLSVAKIPFRSYSFTGFICGLLIKDDFHIFATYNGSTIKNIKVQDKGAEIVINSSGKELSIKALSKKSAVLASPKQGSMEGRIDESMDASVTINLKEKGIDIFEDTGYASGLEIVNPKAIL